MATLADNSNYVIPSFSQREIDDRFAEQIAPANYAMNGISNNPQGEMLVQDADRARRDINQVYQERGIKSQTELMGYMGHETKTQERINLHEETSATHWIDEASRDARILAKSTDSVNEVYRGSVEPLDIKGIYHAGAWIKNMRNQAINLSLTNPASREVQTIRYKVASR